MVPLPGAIFQGLGKGAFRAFLTAKFKRHLPGDGKSGPSQPPSSAQAHQGGIGTGLGRFNRFRCSDQLLTRSLGASSQDMEDEVSKASSFNPIQFIHESDSITAFVAHLDTSFGSKKYYSRSTSAKFCTCCYDSLIMSYHV